MKSLFNLADNNEVIVRIEKLDASAHAAWGKMNVAQMLNHCQEPIMVAFGQKQHKRQLIGMLFGKMAKKQILDNDKPLKKGLPTSPGFAIKDEHNFETERTKLINLVRRFAEKGPAAITKNIHPFFGKMTVHDWNKMMYKHLDHHLRQFGV